MPAAEENGMSAPIGSRFGIVPEVLVDLTARVGGNVKTELPGSLVINRLGTSFRDIRDTWGV